TVAQQQRRSSTEDPLLQPSFVLVLYSLLPIPCPQKIWKLTSTFNSTRTGLPFSIAGLNLYCSTASLAFSSSPMPTPRITRTWLGLPLVSTHRFTRTFPATFALRASSENSGSTE